MSRGRSKDFVALLALMGAVSYGTWLWMRSSLDLGAGWTDGEVTLDSIRGEQIRYAVWDDPEPVEGLQGEPAARPALSPDGRWMVFAIGERGLNMDLFVAELVSGVATEVRALNLVNGPHDELAPAFAEDALYFATDRTGTGDLDIWRAPYEGGSFLPAEPLPRGVNSEADETDPWPQADGGLVFASNRPRGPRRDFELYHAFVPAEEAPTPLVVEPLDALNTPFDERDPSLSADGRTLVFASDRLGTRGGFDLYRSFYEGERWLSPEPLHGVNGRGSERGPLLAGDGFTLFFDRQDAEDVPSELWRAHSRELFRVPTPPVSWREVLVLVTLLVLAVFAWLAKRWTAMEIIYKCFLVSLIVHLLLLWWMRDVYPETEITEIPGSERTFRVRLAPTTETVPDSALERLGELQAMRPSEATEPSPDRTEAELAEESLASATPTSEASLSAPDAPEPAMPSARTRVVEAAPRESLSETALQNREAPLERMSAAAPAMVVVAHTNNAKPRRVAASEPELRAEGLRAEDPDRSGEAPTHQVSLAQPSTPHLLDAAPAAQRLRGTELAPSSAPSPRIALPQESLDELPPATPAPGLAMPEAPSIARDAALGKESAESPAPQRLTSRASESLESWRASSTAEPSTRNTSRVSVPTGPGARAPERSPASLAQGQRAPSELAVQLRSAQDAASDAAPAGTRAASEAPRRFDALAGLDPGANRASRETPRNPVRELGPGRQAIALPVDQAPVGVARPLGPLALSLPTPPAPEVTEDRPPVKIENDLYKNRFGNEKLRALEDFGGGKETEIAVAKGLAYLASIQNPRGYWGNRRDYHDKYGDVRIGKTGLALLSFLGAGHTPRSGAEFASVTERAVDFLLSQLDPNSSHFGDSSSYGHGIATYALAECYALTKDPVLEQPLQKAIDHILETQNQREDPRFNGGWGYYYSDGRVWQGDRWPRVSVTAWQVMALESARLGGVEVPESAFQSARSYLLDSWDPEREAFRYTHDPARLRSAYPILPASTPAALFVLSLLGHDPGSSNFASARNFVMQRMPRGYAATDDDEFVFEATGNLYFWYYGTLAMFRTGGGSWQRWNGAMKETLLPSQESDGSWQPISIYARYAGDDGGDRSYTTAMCVLTLEVYYRYFTPLLGER